MNKIQCPQCKTFKIKDSKTVGIILIIVGLATFVFVVGFFFLFVGLVMLLGKTQYTCESCGYKWKDKIPSAAI